MFRSFMEDNNKLYEYGLKVLALPFREHGKMTLPAFVIQGGMGIGKGVFWKDVIGNLVGRHNFVMTNGFDGLFGNGSVNKRSTTMTADVAPKLLLVADEIPANNLADKMKQSLKCVVDHGKKDLPYIFKEEAVQEVTIPRRYANYVFLCNQLPKNFLESQEDRRFFVTKATNRLLQEYGGGDKNKYSKWMKDTFIPLVTSPEFQKAFYKYLMVSPKTEPDEEFLASLGATIPYGKMRREILLNVTPTANIFFCDYIETCLDPDVQEARKKKGRPEMAFLKGEDGRNPCMPTSDLYGEYKSFMGRRRASEDPEDLKTFSKHINIMISGISGCRVSDAKRQKTGEGKGKVTQHWTFLPAVELKEALEKKGMWYGELLLNEAEWEAAQKKKDDDENDINKLVEQVSHLQTGNENAAVEEGEEAISSQSDGEIVDINRKSLTELKEMAKKRNITGYAQMKKADLVTTLQEASGAGTSKRGRETNEMETN